MEDKPIERAVFTPNPVQPPSREDKLLAFQLKELIHQQTLSEFVNKKTMVDAIVKLRDVKRREAYNMLLRLWRCGLTTRMGRIDPRSNRPSHQLWKID